MPKHYRLSHHTALFVLLLTAVDCSVKPPPETPELVRESLPETTAVPVE